MEVRIETVREYIAHKHKNLLNTLDSRIVCSMCGRAILAGEKYWKTGRDWKKASYRSKTFRMKASTIKIYCDGYFDSKGIWVRGCIEKIYCDVDV